MLHLFIALISILQHVPSYTTWEAENNRSLIFEKLVYKQQFARIITDQTCTYVTYESDELCAFPTFQFSNKENKSN